MRRHGYPVKVRQRLLEGIYAGTPFRTVVRELGLTSQQVSGLTKTDEEWSAELEAALTAVGRDDFRAVCLGDPIMDIG